MSKKTTIFDEKVKELANLFDDGNLALAMGAINFMDFVIGQVRILQEKERESKQAEAALLYFAEMWKAEDMYGAVISGAITDLVAISDSIKAGREAQ